LVDNAPLAGHSTGSTRKLREQIRQRLLRAARPPSGTVTARPVSTAVTDADSAAEHWLDRAWNALSSGDYQFAAYAAALCTRPDEVAQAALICARAAAGVGLLEKAVIEAQRAVQLAPDEPEHHLTLAGILADLGNVRAALHSYRTAERLVPGSTAAHTGLALAATQVGETGWAEQLLESVYAAGRDRRMVGDCLGLVLVEAAEQVPRVVVDDRYVITASGEITLMRAKLDRAAVVAADPDLREQVAKIRGYVETCARRTRSATRLFPVPRWKLNRWAFEREERG
jgi:Flp pilus assembly protein TadD